MIPMNIIVVENKETGAQIAFDMIKEVLDQNKLHTLGLATGSTPVALYQIMAQSQSDFSDVVGVNLDEYYHLPQDHAQSYKTFMHEHLFQYKPFKETHIPNGMALNDVEETARYDQVLKDHPIDIQILGIGSNGHIGFNEPGTSFESRTSKTALSQSTIEDNQRFFDAIDDVPRYSYSMGIASIMEAKQIILLAFGANKADAVALSVDGPITEAVPASILQTHPNVTLILDEAAASKL